MWGRLVGALGLLLAAAADARAQEVPADVEIPDYGAAVAETPGAHDDATRADTSLSIDDVLRTSVYAVSKKPQLVRESPGVVTVITREEILASGARDVTDALLLVPGVSWGVDVQGVIGLAFRGNW